MIERIQIIHNDFIVKYSYTSDNSFDKHFYVTFGVHVVGKKNHNFTPWQWLMGHKSTQEFNEYVEHTFYMQRVKWYSEDGRPASVDEAVTLNFVKDYIDGMALTISEKEKKLKTKCKGKCGKIRPKTVHINELNWAA